MWAIFFLKFLLNLLQYCFYFYVLVFACKACEILTPQPGIELAPPALEGKVLDTGLTGRSQGSPFSKTTNVAWGKSSLCFWLCPRDLTAMLTCARVWADRSKKLRKLLSVMWLLSSLSMSFFSFPHTPWVSCPFLTVAFPISYLLLSCGPPDFGPQ